MSITALEIRPEEIGRYDYEAVKARKARFARPHMRGSDIETMVRAPVSYLVDEVIASRKATVRGVTLYHEPIGPIRIRDMLFVSSDGVRRELPKALRRHVRIMEIQKIVASVYGLTLHEIMSARRMVSVVRPRQEAMWLAKRFTRHSLPEIGRQFGGRDHTTVLHAVRKIEHLLSQGEYEPLAMPHVIDLDAKIEAMWRAANDDVEG